MVDHLLALHDQSSKRLAKFRCTHSTMRDVLLDQLLFEGDDLVMEAKQSLAVTGQLLGHLRWKLLIHVIGCDDLNVHHPSNQPWPHVGLVVEHVIDRTDILSRQKRGRKERIFPSSGHQ